jgi:hypothetical protein
LLPSRGSRPVSFGGRFGVNAASRYATLPSPNASITFCPDARTFSTAASASCWFVAAASPMKPVSTWRLSSGMNAPQVSASGASGLMPGYESGNTGPKRVVRQVSVKSTSPLLVTNLCSVFSNGTSSPSSSYTSSRPVFLVGLAAPSRAASGAALIRGRSPSFGTTSSSTS